MAWAVREEPAVTGAGARVDPDYATRRGFDPDFLGARLPLPTLDASVAAEVAVAPVVPDGILRYHHFTVVMHGPRRLAIYSAANLDGRRRVTPPPHSERWIVDPRLPDAQTGNALYAGNDLDRGHLTRRADMLWGDTPEEAQAAVADTYHFTNCAPQHRDFNQNDTTWQGLEDYILGAIADHRLRANVHTGPVLDPKDPEYRGIQIPRAYWKVVAVTTTERLHATAYLLEQADLLIDLDRAAEEPPLGAYRVYQTRVSHVEALTGIDFGPLRTFDPVEPPHGDADAFLPTELRDLSDVRL